jgi:SRSO17 transposase
MIPIRAFTSARSSRSRSREIRNLANLPASTSRRKIVAAFKARWSCEQMHQQAKEELGLDHFEGRSWFGLHHHAVLTMIAFAFLLHVRLAENKPAA